MSLIDLWYYIQLRNNWSLSKVLLLCSIQSLKRSMASSSSAHLLQQRIQTYYLHHKDKKERKKRQVWCRAWKGFVWCKVQFNVQSQTERDKQHGPSKTVLLYFIALRYTRRDLCFNLVDIPSIISFSVFVTISWVHSPHHENLKHIFISLFV